MDEGGSRSGASISEGVLRRENGRKATLMGTRRI
jgi:hypothetical protein